MSCDEGALITEAYPSLIYELLLARPPSVAAFIKCCDGPNEAVAIFCCCRMWSIWMLTVPSLRARDCDANEKDALNVLFILLPVINVALPFVWKNFGFIFTADCVALGAVYAWKGCLPKIGQSEQA